MTQDKQKKETKDNKKIVRYNAQNLKKKKDKTVTLSFNAKDYDDFKKIMKEQNLSPSSVLNQFMVLTNELLTSQDGGEIAFIFEPNDNKQNKSTKKEEKPKDS